MLIFKVENTKFFDSTQKKKKKKITHLFLSNVQSFCLSSPFFPVM